MTGTTSTTATRLTLTFGTALLLLACGTEPGSDDGTTDGDASTDASTATPEPSTSSGFTTDAPDPDTSSTDAPDPDTTTGEPGEGRSFVLVHGAWMGAWSWERVAPVLEAAGHEVRVVELPAHGDDPTDPARASLDGYRDTVLAAIADAGQPVVLVGHSMGGVVISAVAQAQPADVEALVYVAGYLPADGQSLLDLAFMDPGSIVGEHLVDNGDGTNSIETEAIGEVFCADCSRQDVTLLQDRHRPEPGAPLATPVALTDDAFGSVPRYYVRTAQDLAVSPALQDQMLAATPVDAEATLDTAHSPMLTDPDGLAAEILAFVP